MVIEKNSDLSIERLKSKCYSLKGLPGELILLIISLLTMFVENYSGRNINYS